MRSLRSLLVALLALATIGTGATADDLVIRFSRCLGQMSAEREHSWLVQSDRRAEIEHSWHALASLVDAITDGVGARDALHHRIEAKHMHAALLREATFGTKPARAKAARRLAEQRSVACRNMLLDS
jgi:hypothetical protein